MLIFPLLNVPGLPQSPLTVEVNQNRPTVIRWQDKEVLSIDPEIHVDVDQSSQPARPLYLGYPHGPKDAQFVPEGLGAVTVRIQAARFDAKLPVSGEAFACTTNPKAPLGSSFGRGNMAFVDSIYDRSQDWLVTFESEGLKISPNGSHSYSIKSDKPCTVTFRPNYYRDHLGYFLWDKSKPLWKQPVAGWCSWMAYLQDVKESEVVDAAKFFSKNLKEYGYDVIQIDDGFQRVLQFGQGKVAGEPFSSYWTKPNEKFPSGMDGLAKAIKDQGMVPGVWIGYYLPLGLNHSEGYVTDPDGKPHKGPWVNYAMNGLDPAARDEAYIDTVREFKRQGWDYFKIDTLRHVLYDNYRQTPAYWQGRQESMEQAFRTIMAETKKAAGDSYVLACWGVMPELAGLADGARIGEDVGPNFDSMRRTAKYIAQFQYLNNVVWSNDPDYMCFRVPIEQARAWATMTSLAGGHIMVSDPVDAYDAAHLNALRRVGPTFFTRPLNAASMSPDPEYMALNADKGGEKWTVLARFAWQDLPEGTPSMQMPAGKYLAFDFWNEKYLGVVAQPHFGPLAQGSCQVISLRQDLERPQVLGTNRHLSQGVVELDQVAWRANRLSGRFLRGAGEPWSLYIRVPKGWKKSDVWPATIKSHQDGEVLKLTFPIGSNWMDWEVGFSRS